MSEAFHLGGWGMYPTAIVGAVMVIFAARYALDPTRTRMPLLIGLQVLTFMVATLGFVSGVIRSTTATADLPNAGDYALVGFGESLVNIGWGVALMVVAMIGICIGVARQRPATGGSLVDPLRG